MARPTVADLAHEFHVKIRHVELAAHDAKLKVRGGVRTLTNREAEVIRAVLRQQTTRRAQEPAGLLPAPRVAPSPTWLTDWCACCGLRGRCRVPRLGQPLHCERCETHWRQEGESVERTLERMLEHEPRLLAYARGGFEAASNAKSQAAAALATRDTWRATLVEVMRGHEQREPDGGCVCGATSYPCPTMRVLDAENRGVSRQVECYLGLPDDELRRELYPHEG